MSLSTASLSTAITTNTDLLDQMNSTYDANLYIGQAVQTEEQRLLSLDAHAKRDVYRLQNQTLGVVYSQGKSDFMALLTRVVLFAAMLVVATLCGTSQGMISKRTGVLIGVTIMTLAGVVVVVLISLAATRRNSVWGRFYWKNTGTNAPTNTSPT